MHTRNVAAHIEALPEAIEFITTALAALQCPTRTSMQIELALEELFVNICKYAYANSSAEEDRIIQITWDFEEESRRFTVKICDRGVAFDPLSWTDPDVDCPLEKRNVGGLGIFLAKNNVDELTYARKDGVNIVRFSKGW